MTAIALKQEQTDLLMGLETLLAKCQSVDFKAILNHAISQVKINNATQSLKPRRTDEELASLLAGSPTADIANYQEPTDEEWHIMASQNRMNTIKGIEKWL